MNKTSATQFKNHMELAIRELSSALSVTKEVAAQEEFVSIARSVGNIMAAVDALLHESIYSDHPELNHLRNRLP